MLPKLQNTKKNNKKIGIKKAKNIDEQINQKNKEQNQLDLPKLKQKSTIPQPPVKTKCLNQNTNKKCLLANNVKCQIACKQDLYILYDKNLNEQKQNNEVLHNRNYGNDKILRDTNYEHIGQPMNCNLQNNTQISNELGEIGIFNDNIVYFNETGKLGTLDIAKSHIDYYSFTLHFLFRNSKLRDPGKMVWCNGCCFRGVIQKNYRAKQGIFISQNGVFYIFYSDNYGDNNIINSRYRKRGYINYYSGRIRLKQLCVQFVNRCNYIRQHEQKSNSIGTIKWPNGDSFYGKICDHNVCINPIISHGKITIDGEIGTYFSCYPNTEDSTVYLHDSGKFAYLNRRNISDWLENPRSLQSYENYTIHFQNIDYYTKQHDGYTKCVGTIQLPNGLCYCGQIAKNMIQNGNITLNGERGSILNRFNSGFIYFYKSGKFGNIDLQTFEITYRQTAIHFNCINDFISNLIDRNNFVNNGRITWSDGSYFEGGIVRGQPSNQGKYTTRNGNKQLSFDNFVFFTQTGNIGIMDVNSDVLITMHCTIHFKREEDFMNQFDCHYNCAGTIKWDNGCEFKGQVWHCKPKHGQLQLKDGSKVNIHIERFENYQFIEDSNSNRILRFDFDSGEVMFEIVFRNQSRTEGTIKWLNGGEFVGTIKKSYNNKYNYPEKGQLKLANGEMKSICAWRRGIEDEKLVILVVEQLDVYNYFDCDLCQVLERQYVEAYDDA